MSPTAVDWARSQKVANSNQRALLITLAGMSDDEGHVKLDGPVAHLVGQVGDIDTQNKMERACNALLAAGLLSRQWSFEGYLYHWKLAVR